MGQLDTKSPAVREAIRKELIKIFTDVDVEVLQSFSFRFLHPELVMHTKGYLRNGPPTTTSWDSGAAAAVSIIIGDLCISAHVGDAKTLVCVEGSAHPQDNNVVLSSTAWEPLFATMDHSIQRCHAALEVVGHGGGIGVFSGENANSGVIVDDTSEGVEANGSARSCTTFDASFSGKHGDPKLGGWGDLLLALLPEKTFRSSPSIAAS